MTCIVTVYNVIFLGAEVYLRNIMFSRCDIETDITRFMLVFSSVSFAATPAYNGPFGT